MPWDFLIVLGIVLVIIGSLFIFFDVLTNIFEKRREKTEEEEENRKETKSKVRGGGVVLIGPIPILFGTDRKFLIIAVILAIVLILISFVIFYLPIYL